MRPIRILAAVAVLCAAAAAGCGLGPGEDSGDVGLTVTRDFGSDVLEQSTDSIKESDTVLRVLDRNADVETRYGGGFVQSIDGLAGTSSGQRRTDWFFYVNGVESSVGAAEYDLSDGEKVWWDYHDWTSAMRVPAVVGSWPEPFVHGFEGHAWALEVECHSGGKACGTAGTAIGSVGGFGAGPGAIRVEVGPWAALRGSSPASLLAEAPARSGVFATFTGDRKPLLTLLNDRGEPAGSLGKGAGLVAALRPGDGPPTWIVTGTDAAGVEAAAELLGPQLANHFAVATDAAGPIPVPVQ